ncbi:MAG: glycosyltransferase [Bacteroidaceae bacterium]|nr:glycosyltransferase [Bacteroidaceae bacterium]
METAPLYLAAFVLWALCLWQAIGFGRLGRLCKKQAREPLRTDVPPVSVVLTCHDHEAQLRQNLPMLLGQDYPTDFEIIVVDMHSTDGTKDLLEEFEYAYPHLHHTHCPATARDISLHRLALTLGMRAAAYEWVVFSEADCAIGGTQWLLHLMQPCTDDRDAVLGLMRYDDRRGWAARRRQFFHLWQQMMWLPYAQHMAPYRADEACLCYRRSHFLAHQGFAASANLEAGAATLLVNRHVASGRCGVSVRPEAQVRQELPPARRWRQDRLYYMETRRHMTQGLPYRLRYAIALAAQLLWPVTASALLALTWPNPYVAVPVGVMWLALIVLRQTMFLQSTRALNLRPFHWCLPLLLHLPLLWDTAAWLRWRVSDKKDYRKRFV